MANEGIGAPYAIINAVTLTTAFTGASGTMATKGVRQFFLDLSITWNQATSVTVEVVSSNDGGQTWDLIEERAITAADSETKLRLPYTLANFERNVRVRAKDATAGTHAVLTATAQVGYSPGVPLTS